MLSDKINSLPISQTVAMTAKAHDLKNQGLDVITLSAGEPDFNVPDYIKDAAIDAINENYHKYSPVDGFLDLSYQEKLEITGGDTGYYGNGPKLSNLRANAKAVAEAEAAVQLALEKANAARAELEAAADEEYKAIAAEVKADTAKKVDFTFKRKGEEIFRREMGEPEFWLEKEDRFPRPILSADEQESITRKAETPHDQTPEYNPQHVLSPEYGGVSNYERGVDSFLDELKIKVTQLAYGVPVGSEIHYLDDNTLGAALESRKDLG